MIAPKKVIEIVAKATGISYVKVVTRTIEAERTIEIFALLILSYCHETPTRKKADALNLSELDLIYFKSECLRRMKKSERLKNEVAEIREYIENTYGVQDFDLVDYSKKGVVLYDTELKTNVRYNAQNKPLYFADYGAKALA